MSATQVNVVEKPTRYRFDVQSYHRLGELGVFNDSPRVELLSGEIVAMPPRKYPHIATVEMMRRALERVYPQSTHWVRLEQPLALDDASEPEPDVAVLRGSPLSRPGFAEVELVVEVSESTLAFDRGEKLQLYAQVGIRQYWIANLVDGQLEVYSKPERNGYTQTMVYSLGEVLTVNGGELSVREMLHVGS